LSTLNVLITHLAAEEVDEQVGLLRAIAPESRFAVAYGGSAEEFGRIEESFKTLLGDPSLSGAPRSFQSYNATLAAVWEHWLASEPALDAVYLFEFDHLILAPGFEQSLRELAGATGAGMMGKNASRRNATNWHHYTRFRRDTAVLDQLRRVSVRGDVTAMYGTLGTGMWLSRAAVQAYVGISEHPRCYGELYVPTLVYHLGYEVVDIDAHGNLYDAVRWEPPFSADEVAQLVRAGVPFLHPVKDGAARRAALHAAAAAAQSRREPAPSG
jgi:hypothetical protein